MHSDRFFSPEPRIRNKARELYQSASSLPILAPHGHVDPSLIYNPRSLCYPHTLFQRNSVGRSRHCPK